ncbi:MAG: FecR domain-containing protein [Rhodothermaceae bacterium]|nr:FecR domain-containing protein [Rhodothermaceae bacterium]
MYSDYYETLIHKRLSGELTHEEESVLNEWLEESPQHRAHLEEAERIWKLTGDAGMDMEPDMDIDLENEMARFNERIQADSPAPVKPIKRLRLVWRYAAAAVVLMSSVLFLMQSELVGDDFMLVETGEGETREVTLPDKSTVLLNENSRVSFSKKFSEREIQMNGEVYFDVERDESRPFRVHSGKGMVEVLGTSFVVRYRADESDIQVTVSTGRVAISIPEANQREVLEPGYKGRLVRATNEIFVAPNDNPDYQLWRNRVLSFDITPLSDVIQEMRTHFGIVIEDPSEALTSCTLTAVFTSPRLDDVLQSLSFTFDVDVSIQNGVYEFSGIGCTE